MVKIERLLMSWLEHHLNTFVKPVIGDVALAPIKKPYFTPEELTVIKNAWRSIKKRAQGKTILLPGRDVFIFEILARRENYPTVFIPSCSRMTVAALNCELYRDMFIFDTGFMGSIPKALYVSNFSLLSANTSIKSTQVFQHLTGSRGLALKIERTPKYWKTGRMLDGEIFQELSEKTEFFEAAILTLEVYKSSAPRFNHKKQPLGFGRMRYLYV